MSNDTDSRAGGRFHLRPQGKRMLRYSQAGRHPDCRNQLQETEAFGEKKVALGCLYLKEVNVALPPTDESVGSRATISMEYDVTISLDDIVVCNIEAESKEEAECIAVRHIRENPSEVIDTIMLNVEDCRPCIEEGQELVPFSIAEEDEVPMSVSIGDATFFGFYSPYRIDLDSEIPEGMEVYELCGDKAPKELINGRVEDGFFGSFFFLGDIGLKDGERLAISPNGELREGQFDYSFDGDDIFSGDC